MWSPPSPARAGILAALAAGLAPCVATAPAGAAAGSPVPGTLSLRPALSADGSLVLGTATRRREAVPDALLTAGPGGPARWAPAPFRVDGRIQDVLDARPIGGGRLVALLRERSSPRSGVRLGIADLDLRRRRIVSTGLPGEARTTRLTTEGPWVVVTALTAPPGGDPNAERLTVSVLRRGRRPVVRALSPVGPVDDHVTAVGPRGDVAVLWRSAGAADGDVRTPQQVVLRTVDRHGRTGPLLRLAPPSSDATLRGVDVDARGRFAAVWTADVLGADPLLPAHLWVARGRTGQGAVQLDEHGAGPRTLPPQDTLGIDGLLDEPEDARVAWVDGGAPLLVLQRGGRILAGRAGGPLRRAVPPGRVATIVSASAAGSGLVLVYGTYPRGRDGFTDPFPSRTFVTRTHAGRLSPDRRERLPEDAALGAEGPGVAVDPTGRHAVVAWSDDDAASGVRVRRVR